MPIEPVLNAEDFASENGQAQLLVRSDSDTPVDGFWIIDDIEFVVAE